MSGENPSGFDKKLREKEASKRLPTDPLWEASVRFGKIYEEQLKKAEGEFLTGISPIIELVEKTANAIEEKENFPWLRTQTYTGWSGGPEYRLKKTKKFRVEIIGHHGDQCYPEWQNTGRFVQKVENGQQIPELVNDFSLEYTHTNIYFGIEASKDTQGKVSSVTLKLRNVGEKSSEAINVNNSDFSLFIDKLTDMVANKKYVDNTPSGINMGEGWSIN